MLTWKDAAFLKFFFFLLKADQQNCSKIFNPTGGSRYIADLLEIRHKLLIPLASLFWFYRHFLATQIPGGSKRSQKGEAYGAGPTGTAGAGELICTHTHSPNRRSKTHMDHLSNHIYIYWVPLNHEENINNYYNINNYS